MFILYGFCIPLARIMQWVPACAQILGFPLEAATVLLLPYFGVKYLIDKDNVKDDIGAAVVSQLASACKPRRLAHSSYKTLYAVRVKQVGSRMEHARS